MKRTTLIACIGVLAAGVFATLGFAGIKHFQGPIDQGGTIKFDAKFKHGKPRKTRDFNIGEIPLRCAQGVEVSVRFKPDDRVRVKRRKFRRDFLGGRPKAKVKGKFNQRGNKAEGVFNVAHLPVGPARGCTTNGPREWTAER